MILRAVLLLLRSQNKSNVRQTARKLLLPVGNFEHIHPARQFANGDRASKILPCRNFVAVHFAANQVEHPHRHSMAVVAGGETYHENAVCTRIGIYRHILHKINSARNTSVSKFNLLCRGEQRAKDKKGKQKLFHTRWRGKGRF